MTASGLVLASLSRARRTAADCEQSIENHAIINADFEIGEADLQHQIVNDEQRFNVRGIGLGTDGIEIALDEFAVASFLRILSPPDRAYVIAFERGTEFVDVLRGETGERNCQVEPHGNIAAPLLETEHLLV
jgi:hypothetical protein